MDDDLTPWDTALAVIMLILVVLATIAITFAYDEIFQPPPEELPELENE